MKLKYYQIHQDGEGQFWASETEAAGVMDTAIGIKGKIPAVGEQIKMRKYRSVIHAEVTSFTENGIPLRGTVTYADNASMIKEGEVIEFVGYIIQLLNLLDVIFWKVKSWFSQKEPVMKSAAVLFTLHVAL